MNGSNDASNIVVLTPEEHYLAHQLLVKIYPNNFPLLFAALQMTVGRQYQDRSNNKLYGWLRRKHSNALSNRSKGIPKSEAHRKALSLARLGKPGVPRTEEWKRKISESNKKTALTRDYSGRRDAKYREHQSEKGKLAWIERKKKKKLNLENIGGCHSLVQQV
jgi:hypothetical protein